MNITGFNPQIITKDAEAAIATLEALGFARTHNKTGDDDVVFSSVRMKDANGFHVDVVKAEGVPFERDLTTIRINVDDFDAARELLLSKGYRESKAFGEHETPSSRYAYFVAPSGHIIDVCQHLKE